MRRDHESTSGLNDPQHVAVCIITFQRPLGLRRLLEGLTKLTFANAEPAIQIIVVDNDSDGSARAVCEQVRSTLRWPLHYHIEKRRGIPCARNKTIECAGQEADFIVMIDDDEVPAPSWLDELLRVQKAYDADVVSGPVYPVFHEGAPDWILRGRHFHHYSYQTGKRPVLTSSNNVLIRSQVFKQMERHFDERLALSGGEDGHFFKRVETSGFKIIWADEAVVHEWVPASRANAKWIIRRFYRNGTTRCWRDKDLKTSPLIYLILPATGCVYILAGLLLFPVSLLRGKHAIVWSLRYMAYGTGMLVGLSGKRFEEYRTIHGS